MISPNSCSKCGGPLSSDSPLGLCSVCASTQQEPSSGHNIRPATDAPGTIIGRYKLVEKIGEGGFGVVYVAEQSEPVYRKVALKILKLGMDTQSVVARFEIERQALALMDHPNIARVLDAGATETGRPYFVMELVQGEQLLDYSRRRELTLAQQLELFIPVCRAVQHAHQKGTIHRDLKPSNILVTEREGLAIPKVIDFGIAKITEQELDEKGGLTSMSLFLGTPAYMSPEQVEFGQRDIDTRSDIYSLGVILYELITGRLPFEPKQLAAAGVEQMRRTIREVDPPRPSVMLMNKYAGAPASPQTRERLAAIRGDLDWIIMKCLEKDRTRRYETANGLATDILRHLDHQPVIARPPSGLYRLQKAVQRHRLVFGASAAIAVVMISAVLVSTHLALRARKAEKEQGRLRNLAETEARDSRERLIRRYVAEGNRFLEQGRPTLALPWLVQALQLETGDPQRESDERLRIAQALIGAPELRANVAHSKWVNCVALSPDGTLLASGGEDGVIRISNVARAGESIAELTLPGAVGRLNFSSDGRRLVALDLVGHAEVWDTVTGKPVTPVLRAEDFGGDAAEQLTRPFRPAASFSRDGKTLLLGWGSRTAQLRDAASGALVHEFKHQDVIYHAAFSADGLLVATCSKDGTAQVWSAASGEPVGPPLRPGGPITLVQFSSSGDELLTVRERHTVQLWNWRDAKPVANQIPRRSVLFDAALSPDDSKILTVARSGYALLYEASTSRQINTFEHEGGLIDAAFSPNSKQVAIACHDGNVWLWNVNDVERRPMVLPEGNQIEEIAFSADGRLLAAATRGGHARVWELSPPAQGVQRLAGSDVQWVDLDKSGRRALLLNTGRQTGISVYDVVTGEKISSSALPEQFTERAQFSPDADRVLVFDDGLIVLDTKTGHEMFRIEGKSLREALWSPDGKRILTVDEQGAVNSWDSVSGKLANNFACSSPARAVAISPDGTKVATADNGKTVQLWELSTGQRTGEALTLSQEVRGVAFSPDGKRLAISTYAHEGGGLVEVHDLSSGKMIGRPLEHRDEVVGLTFSPDGRLLGTACNDHTARVWDALTGEPVSPWLQQDYEGRQIVFSPDAARVATRARRGMVRLWSAQTGEPITLPMLYRRNTGDGRVCYSPDGQSLLLCRGGNEAWIRQLKPDTRSLEELKLLAEVMSCSHFDERAGMVPLSEAELNVAWKRLGALRSDPAAVGR